MFEVQLGRTTCLVGNPVSSCTRLASRSPSVAQGEMSSRLLLAAAAKRGGLIVDLRIDASTEIPKTSKFTEMINRRLTCLKSK